MAYADSKSFAIIHATLLTMTHGTISDGTLIVTNGKIASLGTHIEIPPGTETIDAHNSFLMPGLIDPHSHLGDYSIPEDLNAYDDGNEETGDIQARVRSLDSINPNDPEIARAVSGGVTMVQVLPGSSNNIGGHAAIVKLLGDTPIEMLFRDAPPTMKMAWGENPKRAYFVDHHQQPPGTLMGEMAMVRQAFYDAENYMKVQGQPDKKPLDSRINLNLQALANVLQGKTYLHIHSYQINHFESLFQLQDEFHLKIAALHHALEAYRIADEIARRDIGVVTFAGLWGYKVEAWNAIPQNAWILWKKGITVSLHTDNPVIEEKSYIKQATLVAHYGMPEEVALQMITINPAKLLHVDPWVGSLDTGKDADLTLWDKNPLSPRSHVEKVWINGILTFTKEEGYLPWKGRDSFIP